jgi:(S)-2-hydroxyglutarate dehydrogenase
MTRKLYDLAIVGGGIVGTATAMELTARKNLSVVILEAEKDLAAHQTGHNSGVIHSGLYYKPGSLKAKNCVEGREALYRFCEEHDIAHERCGKLVVATREAEIASLDELQRRGLANGLRGLKRLGSDEIKEYEPHCTGVAGLLVSETGIVDYTAVTRKYAELAGQRGTEIKTRSAVISVSRWSDQLVLDTRTGPLHCRNLVNCAGLQCDRIARMCGVRPGLKIVPFRGEYYLLAPQRQHLVKNLIYPVPDPRFPFLGVHFTRMIHGGIEVGPNAVLAFRREGYKKWQLSPRDLASWLFYAGFWKMAGKYWRMGLMETWRSYSKRAFVNSMRELVPDIANRDVKRGGAGVRAQALEPDGTLVDDFRIVEAERMIHVLNAPSPAATASISIGKTLAAKAIANFDF